VYRFHYNQFLSNIQKLLFGICQQKSAPKGTLQFLLCYDNFSIGYGYGQDSFGKYQFVSGYIVAHNDFISAAELISTQAAGLFFNSNSSYLGKAQ